MTEVQCSRNWAKIRSKSIDTAKQFPASFLQPFRSEELDHEIKTETDLKDPTNDEVETLQHWIKLGETSQSDFRRGSSPFHMSLMSDTPPVLPAQEKQRPPKLQKRFSSLPETTGLGCEESFILTSKPLPKSLNPATELLRKRRKQLESIHKMRIQEEYFDSLFEQNEARSKEDVIQDFQSDQNSARGMTVLRSDKKVEDLYEFKENLGSGRFGKVTLVVEKTTGQKFAAKQLPCRRPSQKKEYEEEVAIMNELNHPKLLVCEDAFIEGRTATLVLELVTGGELFDRISDENFDLTEIMAVKYLKQILDGINYMHSKNILHLDLKPENVLCLRKDKLDSIKIIDFGFARHYDPGKPLKVMFGTPEFVAPEVVNFDPLGKGTDVWSIGVIAYVMVSGLSPFMGENDQETLSNVCMAELDFDDEVFDEVSDEAKDFIEMVLTRDERNRATCEQCLEHEWFSENFFKKASREAEQKSLNAARGNLKKFIARRRLQRSINAVRAITRLAISLRKSSIDSDDSTKSPITETHEKIDEVDEQNVD